MTSSFPLRAAVPLAVASPRPRHEFNPTIHGARGLLAVLVFVFHVGASGAPGFAWQTTGIAHAALVSLQFAVEIFFCVSGYVIAATLRRSPDPGTFLRQRAIRILPVLWVTLAVIVPLGLATRQGAFATLSAADLAWVLPGNLLPLAGALPVPVLQIPAWSLSYELLFYLIAAALWWLPTQRHVARFAVMAVATGLIIWHPRAIFFVVGVCAAHTRLPDTAWLRQAMRAPCLMFAGFLACWYTVQLGTNPMGAVQEGTLFDWAADGRISLAATAIGFGALGFAGVVAGEGWLGAFLRTKPLQRLGTLSFSFYLWHVIVIGVVKRLLAATGGGFGPWSQLVLLAICLPVSLVIADCSVRLIEQNVTRWFTQRSLARPALV